MEEEERGKRGGEERKRDRGSTKGGIWTSPLQKFLRAFMCRNILNCVAIQSHVGCLSILSLYLSDVKRQFA